MRVEAIHAALAAEDLLPSEHLVDSAYVSADHLVRAREQHSIDLVGPGRSQTGWQARTEGAFEATDFAIDWEGQAALCPEGQASTSWRGYHDQAIGPYVRARFSAANCNACPSKPRCTRGREQGRQLTLPARGQQRRSRPPGRAGTPNRAGTFTLSARASRARSAKGCAASGCGARATAGWPRRACKPWPPPRPSTLTASRHGSPNARSHPHGFLASLRWPPDDRIRQQCPNNRRTLLTHRRSGWSSAVLK